MEITEVRIKLVNDGSERVKAFCSVTLDKDFVIRDLKVIEGTNGLFLAMPSRKLADHCPKCSGKNHLRARFCNFCGARLNENRAPRDEQGRAKLHADVAHPINATCREMMQAAVVEAFNRELERSHQPGYTPQALDDDDYEPTEYSDFIEEVRESVAIGRGELPADRNESSDRSGGPRRGPGNGSRKVPPRPERTAGPRRDEPQNTAPRPPARRENRVEERPETKVDERPVTPPPAARITKPAVVQPPPAPPRKPVIEAEDAFGAGIL